MTIMKSIFRVVFYLRRNYVNKEGKTSVMLRIYLNNERLSLCSTGIAITASQWDKDKERIKGRTTDALSTNLQLDNIASGLQAIFRKIEMSDDLSIERIKSEFLGKKDEIYTLMQLFEKYNTDISKQVGISVSKATLQKYNVCKRHFSDFLDKQYKRNDIKLTELTYLLLDIPKAIIDKYNPAYPKRENKLFPILSNQKMNAYLKEIADLCGIKKNLTFHLARHTFATMSLSKGVPMESVSKMLGHTNIKTTQIYARITNKKIEHDMEELAGKLGKFNNAMGI